LVKRDAELAVAQKEFDDELRKLIDASSRELGCLRAEIVQSGGGGVFVELTLTVLPEGSIQFNLDEARALYGWLGKHVIEGAAEEEQETPTDD